MACNRRSEATIDCLSSRTSFRLTSPLVIHLTYFPPLSRLSRSDLGVEKKRTPGPLHVETRTLFGICNSEDDSFDVDSPLTPFGFALSTPRGFHPPAPPGTSKKISPNDVTSFPPATPYKNGTPTTQIMGKNHKRVESGVRRGGTSR